MQQSKTTLKQKEMMWRQQKVIELAADGYTEREIATRLKISDTTIHRDLTLLKQQAKEQIRSYIQDKVPFEYHKTLEGLSSITKSMANIIANSTDNKEIMQASTIKMQAYNMRMELVSNANLVYEAIGLVDKYRGYVITNSKQTIDVQAQAQANHNHNQNQNQNNKQPALTVMEQLEQRHKERLEQQEREEQEQEQEQEDANQPT